MLGILVFGGLFMVVAASALDGGGDDRDSDVVERGTDDADVLEGGSG